MDWYFQLLNPLVFLIFAGGFVCIHKMRSSRAALVFAASYVVGAIAFLADIVFQNSESIAIRTIIAGLYAITVLLLVCGIWRHYRGPAPWRTLVGILIVHMAIYAALLSLEWSWMRSFSANFGCGLILIFGLAAMHGKRGQNLDATFYMLHLTSCILCFARPILIAFLSGDTLTNTSHDDQILVVSLHLVAAFAAVSTGMILLIILSRDIFEDLKVSSLTDPLTGLLNRRGFELEAARYIKGHEYKCLTLTVIDIDHFKRVNDTYGHSVGDEVIVTVGRMLTDTVGTEGIVSRIGGEEFVIITQGFDLVEAVSLADRVRSAIPDLRVASDNLRCTASFGVAQHRSTEDLASTLKRADQALYLAKTMGRNCVKSETDLAVHELNRLAKQIETGDIRFSEAARDQM
ncbi:MAG: GGDEF domain-containing protein [Pseudomonadota bacterium]